MPQQGEHPCPDPRQTSGVDDELRKLLEKEEKEVEVKYITFIKIILIITTCRVSLKLNLKDLTLI